MTDREIILLALDTLILKLEVERLEYTFSGIQDARLSAARRAREYVASWPSAQPT